MEGISPTVEVTLKSYERGVRLTREAFQGVESLLRRSSGIKEWSVLIASGSKPKPRLNLTAADVIAMNGSSR